MSVKNWFAEEIESTWSQQTLRIDQTEVKKWSHPLGSNTVGYSFHPKSCVKLLTHKTTRFLWFVMWVIHLILIWGFNLSPNSLALGCRVGYSLNPCFSLKCITPNIGLCELLIRPINWGYITRKVGLFFGRVISIFLTHSWVTFLPNYFSSVPLDWKQLFCQSQRFQIPSSQVQKACTAHPWLNITLVWHTACSNVRLLWIERFD